MRCWPGLALCLALLSGSAAAADAQTTTPAPPAVAALLVAAVAFWAITRTQRVIAARIVAAAEKTVTKSKIADLEMLQGMRLTQFEHRLAMAATGLLYLAVLYGVLAFGLRQFPYT